MTSSNGIAAAPMLRLKNSHFLCISGMSAIFFHVGECIRIVASCAIFHGLPKRLLQYRAIEGE